MVYLSNYIYHRWHQFMSERHWCQRGLAPPGCRIILTNVKSVYPHCMAWGGVGPLWSGSRTLPLMGSRGVLLDLILDLGQLTFSQVPIEGWIIDPHGYGLPDVPGNVACFPNHYGKTVHIDVVS